MFIKRYGGAVRRILPPLVITAAVQVYSLAMFACAEEGLYYFWRYGFFTLLGYAGGLLCFLIPAEKLNSLWTPARGRFAVGILGGLFALYAAHWFITHPQAVYNRLNGDVNAEGYIFAYITEHWRSAPLFSVNSAPLPPQYANGEILMHSLNVFGLIPTIAVMAASLALPVLLAVKLRGTLPPVLRLIALLGTAYLAFQFVFSGLWQAGFSVYYGARVPFIGYDRFFLVFDLCVFGICLRPVARRMS